MIVLLLALTALQDQAESYRLTPKIEAAIENGKPAFLLTGTTDLPDGAVVYLDLFRAGTQEGSQLFYRATRVAGGAWKESAFVFSERTLSGKYYLRARFDLNFQDRKDVGETVQASKKNSSAKGEAWLSVGTKEDLEREYRDTCLLLSSEMDAMDALAQSGREAYRTFRAGGDFPALKAKMQEIREKIGEIEHRHAERVEYRYYGLTEVSHVGLEHLRGMCWAILDSYLKAVSEADKTAKLESECEIRFDTLRQLIRKYKSGLQVPHVPTRDLKLLLRDLKTCLDQAMTTAQALETGKVRARMAAEHRKLFQDLLLDLTSAVDEGRYAQIQEIAQSAGVLFDKLSDPKILEDPQAMKDVVDKANAVAERLHQIAQ